MKASRPKVLVVGAGIVGAAIAYHLARRHAAVTLIDKADPATGVTGLSFAWINVAHGAPECLLGLRHLAIQDYRGLEQELRPALMVDWCGALSWACTPAETAEFVRQHAAWSYDIRLLDRREVARLEPNLINPPPCAAFAASEGAVDPVAVTEALVRAAGQAGAEVRPGTEVMALNLKGDTICGVRTKQGTVDADVVVLAAGIETGKLCNAIGSTVPIEASPALLLRFRSPGHLVKTVISSPDLEVRQNGSGRLLAAEDFEPGWQVDDIARRTVRAITEHLHGGEHVELDEAQVGLRPIPSGGIPIIGFAPRPGGLYIAAMHAAVTLAPTVGRLAAAEILDGADVELLKPCRPGRFSSPHSIDGRSELKVGKA